MPIEPQSLYMQLGRLLETMPHDLAAPGPMPTPVMQWLGRADALIQATGQIADMTSLVRAVSNLKSARRMSEGQAIAASAVEDITLVLHEALARAELNAPVTAQGSFILAGNALDALVAIDKVLQMVTRDVLIVDPYMDQKAVIDYAVLTPEGMQIRLLADQDYVKPSLKPAVTAWLLQHGATRPLEAKLAPARTLHDRLIAVDGTVAFTLTQSLNAFAARSPASIVRVDPETAALKITAYEAMWTAAALL